MQARYSKLELPVSAWFVLLETSIGVREEPAHARMCQFVLRIAIREPRIRAGQQDLHDQVQKRLMGHEHHRPAPRLRETVVS